MAATKEYFDFIGSVKDRIRSAQYDALKAVNKELVGLYWDIGRMISEKQKELGWGKSIVENIAKDLSTEFPGQRGFSTTNIWLMVQLYIEYEGYPNLQSMIGEIAWTTRVLEHQIDNKTYEKYLLNQTNYDGLPAEKFKVQC